jgi:hypothetical protein
MIAGAEPHRGAGLRAPRVDTGCELGDAASEPMRVAAGDASRATAPGPKTSGKRREVSVNASGQPRFPSDTSRRSARQ